MSPLDHVIAKHLPCQMKISISCLFFAHSSSDLRALVDRRMCWGRLGSVGTRCNMLLMHSPPFLVRLEAAEAKFPARRIQWIWISSDSAADVSRVLLNHDCCRDTLPRTVMIWHGDELTDKNGKQQIARVLSIPHISVAYILTHPIHAAPRPVPVQLAFWYHILPSTLA
jgi:hypothetical protein